MNELRSRSIERVRIEVCRWVGNGGKGSGERERERERERVDGNGGTTVIEGGRSSTSEAGN